MTSGDGRGTLILSIDFELDLEHQAPVLQRRLDAVRGELIELTRTLNTPATWAVADPTLSAATESILAAGCGHEIAVLGEPAWLGPGCGRMRLERELTRRFDSARESGIAVSTLALRNVEHVVELVLRHNDGAFPSVERADEDERAIDAHCSVGHEVVVREPLIVRPGDLVCAERERVADGPTRRLDRRPVERVGEWEPDPYSFRGRFPLLSVVRRGTPAELGIVDDIEQ